MNDTAPTAVGPTPPDNPFGEASRSDRSERVDRATGHLLRRAEFGSRPERLDAYKELTPQQRVDDIFDFDPKSDVGGLNQFLDNAKSLFDIRRNPPMVAEWWFHRMVNTPFPLQERIAVFWHDHFATSASKVGRSDWMADQIELFRTDGLGSFRDLLVKVGRQPAMLRWLDGNNSHKSNPNENYGREILELFAVGVGNYTEKDVQELARAFTGWQINGSSSRFHKERFDDGDKTLFAGKPYETKAKLDSESAVDAILKHPESARFIGRRLFQTFVHPEPTQEHVDHVAGRLRHHQWHVGNVLKELLKTRLMHSDWAYRSRIKSPVELVVGACYATGATPRAQYLREACARMGQSLLYPPNVAGWDGGQTWINATTVIERFRFGMNLGQHGFNEFVGSELRTFLTENDITTATGIIDKMGNLMLDGEVRPELRGRLLDYFARDSENKPTDFKLDGRGYSHKVRGGIQILASTPAYQLA
jgi:hypothetical protein